MELDTNELIAASVGECVDLELFADVDVETFTYQIVLHSLCSFRANGAPAA